MFHYLFLLVLASKCVVSDSFFFSSQLFLVIYLLWFIVLHGIRGSLMDDAMILPCGHSFGSGGIEHVLRLVSYCQDYCSYLLKFLFIMLSTIFFQHIQM